MMKRFGVVVSTVAALLSASAADAAEVTRVATAFEDARPFQLYLDLGFQRSQEISRITRAWHQNGDLQDVNELHYYSQSSALKVDAHVGLYQDLELHYGLPLILSQNESFRYVGGTTPANSTITNNCLNPDGSLTNSACPSSGVGSVPMFAVPQSSDRGGLGNMTFGLKYALFNQAKDDTKPTWTLAFDYEAPTAARLDPTVRTSSIRHGDIGDRVHKYQVDTALSRRYGPADPYVEAFVMFPALGSGFYDNCSHPNAGSLAAPANCGVSGWTKQDTAIQPPMQLGFSFGTELNLVDLSKVHQRFAIDLRAIATYVGPGRYYNELSYLFEKLLATEEYLQLGGSLALIAQAADYVSFKVRASLLYNTEHGLTMEKSGRDINNDGTVNLAPGSPEVNPTYDFRADAPGRQFRISQVAIFQIDVFASFNF